MYLKPSYHSTSIIGLLFDLAETKNDSEFKFIDTSVIKPGEGTQINNETKEDIQIEEILRDYVDEVTTFVKSVDRQGNIVEMVT